MKNKRKDILNGKLAEYDTFVNNLYSKCNANMVTWNMPAAQMSDFLSLLNKWNAKWTISKMQNNALAKDRKATNIARKNLTKFLRPFVQVYVMRNANLTDADIVTCGLQPYDRTRTRVGRPDSIPSMEYKSATVHTIEVFYRQGAKQKGVKNRGKPLNVAFCKIRYSIGENPPKNIADFEHTVLITRSPGRIQFDGEDAGKKVTFAACWVSVSNLEGDSTNTQTLIIP
jgi:hypothetical protein